MGCGNQTARKRDEHFFVAKQWRLGWREPPPKAVGGGQSPASGVRTRAPKPWLGEAERGGSPCGEGELFVPLWGTR